MPDQTNSTTEQELKPDQERVKNLLSDTVTLLCKNGLAFKDRLRIEGLLGVSIDNNDVFFVHISENIQENPPDPSPPTETTEEQATSSPAVAAPNSPTLDSSKQQDSPCPPSTTPEKSDSPVSTEAKVKPELSENDDDLLIVEEPKSEVFERRASMVAGQRRARSPLYQQEQDSGGDFGEPPSKRHMSSSDNDNQGEYDEQHQSQLVGWPDYSQVSEPEFNQSAIYQHNSSVSSSGFDTTTPGCSNWPSTLVSQSQTQDSDGHSTKKFPENMLSSGLIRNALLQHIVHPLVSHQRKMMAFRLVWTSKHCRDTESVWPNIMDYQKDMSHQLKQLPGVEFFFTSITATTSTGKTKSVNPGLAFWVAINPFMVHESQIYITMRNNILGAELKIMTHKAVQNEFDLHVHNLSMVVKDFGPGFVHNKINSMLGPNEKYLRDRIYMKATQEAASYPGVLLNAQEVLAEVGLQFYLETY